jgi:GNAT superfamily N-acetyltransferase
MEIKQALSDKEISACYTVMQELRPHITADSFVGRIREQEKSGYTLIYLELEGKPVAVAGFRLGKNLAWGRFLYVDDLVTLESHRSQGFGTALLDWLKQHAKRQGCSQLHLDSGSQRKAAHRFYEREGMEMAGYHFYAEVTPAS